MSGTRSQNVYENFPDRVHVERIRQSLWCENGQAPGRAAVMIGSGFSRNANPNVPDPKIYPLWKDISKALHKDLAAHDSKVNITDPLRLGSVYRTVFGPAALDNRLRDLIPDEAYDPGETHQLLLKLPWADVFTTNYDTLLERGKKLAPKRRYGLVLTPEDIPFSASPRIVKLHGSLPSKRPFIFTAEDYRTYPGEFAPFVNLVQQSVMENIFCLLGFSGEDPNFLQWIGWVRDELGDYAPQIYLCGLLSLNSAKSAFYKSLDVIPIDLSSVFSEANHSPDTIHRDATNWFLKSLLNGKRIERRGWPRFSDSQQGYREGIPPPLPPPPPPVISPWPEYERSSETNEPEPINAEIFEGLQKALATEQKEYPGWIVCPEKRLALVRHHKAENWIYRGDKAGLTEWLDALVLTERLRFLRDLVWAVRVRLYPLSIWIDEYLIRTLEPLTPGEKTPDGTPWQKIENYWIELAFVLARDAWEESNQEKFNRWMEQLRPVVEKRPELRSRWYYLRCWFYVLRLDYVALRKTLEEWPDNKTETRWQAERAVFLAELGERKDAKRILLTQLERLGAGEELSSNEFVAKSLEAWLIWSARCLVDWGSQEEDAEALRRTLGMSAEDREQELRREYCDPAADVEARVRAVRNEAERAIHAGSRKEFKFDPGRKSETIYFGGHPESAALALLHT